MLEDQLFGALNVQDGIFAALFVWLLWKTTQDSKARETESRQREDKLFSFLENMKDEFTRLVTSYESLSKDVKAIKDELDRKG